MKQQTRSRSRSAARLAAVQALYQQEMEGTPLPRLLKEFHDHRLGAVIEDDEYHAAERDFFDDVVTGAEARREEIDAQRRSACRSSLWSGTTSAGQSPGRRRCAATRGSPGSRSSTRRIPSSSRKA